MRNLHHPLPGSIHSGISARVLSIKSTSFTGLGPLFLENNLKACFRSLCLSLEEEVGFCFITALCFLTTFNSFLHSLTFLISNCLKLLFVTQGKPRRLTFYSEREAGGGCGGGRGRLFWGGPWALLGTIPRSRVVSSSSIRQGLPVLLAHKQAPRWVLR